VENLVDSLKAYIEKLVELDNRIYQVVLFGSILSDRFSLISDIDMVCLFEPSFDDPNKGWETVIALEQKMHEAQIKLGIHHPIDLGFMQDHKPHLPRGWAYPKSYEILYSDDKLIKELRLPTFQKLYNRLCVSCENSYECELCWSCSEHCDCRGGPTPERDLYPL